MADTSDGSKREANARLGNVVEELVEQASSEEQRTVEIREEIKKIANVLDFHYHTAYSHDLGPLRIYVSAKHPDGVVKNTSVSIKGNLPHDTRPYDILSLLGMPVELSLTKIEMPYESLRSLGMDWEAAKKDGEALIRDFEKSLPALVKEKKDSIDRFEKMKSKINSIEHTYGANTDITKTMKYLESTVSSCEKDLSDLTGRHYEFRDGATLKTDNVEIYFRHTANGVMHPYNLKVKDVTKLPDEWKLLVDSAFSIHHPLTEPIGSGTVATMNDIARSYIRANENGVKLYINLSNFKNMHEDTEKAGGWEIRYDLQGDNLTYADRDSARKLIDIISNVF